MIGTTLDFRKQVEAGRDELNNPVYNTISVEVEDCLIGPTTEPADARLPQAMTQYKDTVRVHLPKAFTGDVSSSYFLWQTKLFHLDSDSVVFMDENTPTRWNRYFRAESLGAQDDPNNATLISFFVTEDSDNYLQPESP